MAAQEKGSVRRKPPAKRPATQTRGEFDTDKAGWHACPYTGMRQWLAKGETCCECGVEDDCAP